MIINFLDKIYSSLRVKDSKFQSLMRFSIREITNAIVPFFLKISRRKVKLNEEGQKIIVSLTTFPDRVDKVWIVIETMLRQTLLPSKIILWLAEEQFPNKEKDLSKSLIYYLKNNLLEIKFLKDDLRSHKKYYYALQEYPDDIIITVDDDIFYSNNIVEDLVTLHKKYPATLCSLRGHRVTKKNDKITKYKDWEKIFGFFGPTFEVFHTSGGGTLYKKDFFKDEVFNLEVIKKYCFFADDVWLNFMLQLAKTKTVKGEYFSNLIPIKNKGFKLSTQNVSDGANDKQLHNLISYYDVNEQELF
ncbi:hypothetical protein ABXT08_05990 [Chryseobacterium sp. NRRL B-14859]|uniref:hypothetical protein n=1 Tax=Chryseobacterium sp. NRRL B-14859 TaxID=1562763 RepID=UPI003393959A